MSGVGEASLVLGIISSIIAIIDATKQIYDAVEDEGGLPENFKKSSAKLPLISNLLRDAERYVDDMTNEVDKSAFLLTLKDCKFQASQLKKLFEKVIPEEGASRMDRYIKAVRTIGKDSQVESLMKGILYDLQLLATSFPVKPSNEYQLAQAIEEVSKMKSSLPDQYTFMPFDRNDGLVDRTEIFESLDQLLNPAIQNRSVAIWGLGGCGKTQIALEYAYRCRDKNSSSIFWIRADSEATFVQDYSDLAKIARLSSDLKAEDLLNAVKQWIENQKDWVLILDNADDLRIFKESYSTSENKQADDPKLLRFIPRHRSLPKPIWDTRFHIIKDEKSILELLEGLGNLPLAIVQAASYIRNTKISVRQYLKSFESEQSDLLSEEFQDVYRPDSNVPNAVMRTWHISMKKVAEESPCSERILNTIAFFNNKGIPFKLIEEAAGATYSNHEILLAATRLSDYSLLQAQRAVDEELPTYEQHRLVQLATRRYYWEQGHSEKAEQLDIEVLALRKEVLGEKHPDTIFAMENLASTWWQQGHSEKAEQLEIEVLALRKEVLGEKHPGTIFAMANLASTWRQQGHYEKAEQLEIEVLSLRKEVLGEKHPDTILAMANLASTWWQQGYYEKAKQLQIEVLALQKEVLGEKHPDTILAMANLASTWRQQGHYEKAEQLEIEVLSLRKKILGEKHPFTILAMANLASTWQQQGYYEKAEQLQIEVLALQKEVLGEKHPDTILAMANLASTWRRQGYYEKAEQLEIEVLSLRKKILGEKHPFTILAMANLASTWQQQGYYEKAEQLQIEVLALQKEVFGEKHPFTIFVMANLASTWWQQGHSEKAEQLEIEVLSLRKKILGEKHPGTIFAMANLASTWYQQDQSSCITKRDLGEKHPDTIFAMANIALTWWEQSHYEKAEQLQIEVLALQKEILGEKHPDTIKAMANIVLTWWDQGHYEKAKQLQIEVLALRKEVIGEKHPDTITAMTKLTEMNQQQIYNAEEVRSNITFPSQLKKRIKNAIRFGRPKNQEDR
ncbi:TPR domain-containing protein [Botrytis cinerea]